MIVWSGLLVRMHAKRRVLFRQLLQSDAHLVLVRLRLRLHGDRDHRLRKVHALQRDRLLQVAQCVAGGDVLEANCSGDIAGAHFLDFLAVVGVHLQDAANALFLALDRVVYRVARIQHARVDAEEGQVADERVGRDLERQRRERLLVIGVTLTFRFVVVQALDRGHIDRRRHVIDHRIEHRLHALVLECGATHGDHDLTAQGARTQPVSDLIDTQGAALEKLVEQRLVALGSRLDHLAAPESNLFPHLGRDLTRLVGHAHTGVIPVDCTLLDQVHDTGKFFFRTDRQLDWHRVRCQSHSHLLDDTQEIGAGPIHLVDENQPRNFVLVALPPDRFGLWLYATDRTQYRDSAVEDAQAALDFDREVDMSGRVDNIDAVLLKLLVHALPETGRGGRRNRDTAFLLLFHPVHDGSTIMNLTYLVRDTGIEKDALSSRRLARVNMGHDADIAVTLDGCCARHALISNYPGIPGSETGSTSGSARKPCWLLPYDACLLSF